MLNECFSINAILMFRSFPDWVFVKVAQFIDYSFSLNISLSSETNKFSIAKLIFKTMLLSVPFAISATPLIRNLF